MPTPQTTPVTTARRREEVPLPPVVVNPGPVTPSVHDQHLATDRPRSLSGMASKKGSRPEHPPVYNRIRTLMIHAPHYSFQGQARLAADAGVSRSTISRLVRGRINPSFRLAQAVTAALEKHLKRPLDPREVLSPDGTYPTASGCEIAGCQGCMPEEAYDPQGTLKPEYRDLRPGDWSLSRPSQKNSINQEKETK